MLRLFIYLLFILSVAFASAGVVLSSRLRNRYKSGFFSTLLYFQVFIFTFGFYGIWGQLVIKTFLTDYVSPESIGRFTDISLLMGLPFLVFAWMMLIKFALEISGRKSNNWFVFSFKFSANTWHRLYDFPKCRNETCITGKILFHYTESPVHNCRFNNNVVSRTKQNCPVQN